MLSLHQNFYLNFSVNIFLLVDFPSKNSHKNGKKNLVFYIIALEKVPPKKNIGYPKKSIIENEIAFLTENGITLPFLLAPKKGGKKRTIRPLLQRWSDFGTGIKTSFLFLLLQVIESKQKCSATVCVCDLCLAAVKLALAP